MTEAEIAAPSTTACSTITEFFTPAFSNVELEPITVTVTEWSNLDQPLTTVIYIQSYLQL